MRILRWTGFVLINLFFLVLLLGMFTPHEFKGTASTEIGIPRPRLFAMLTDFENIPGRRQHIRKVEKLPANEKGLPVWKEFMSTGGFTVLEVLESREPEFLHISMKDSSFEMKGNWKYTLSEKGNGTEITLEEASSVEALPLRLALFFSNQNSKVTQELDNLKKTVESR